jgi:hypothetical protein
MASDKSIAVSVLVVEVGSCSPNYVLTVKVAVPAAPPRPTLPRECRLNSNSSDTNLLQRHLACPKCRSAVRIENQRYVWLRRAKSDEIRDRAFIGNPLAATHYFDDFRGTLVVFDMSVWWPVFNLPELKLPRFPYPFDIEMYKWSF